jgi:hypothetical protein
MNDVAQGGAQVRDVLVVVLPWVVWCVWWLWAVNWKRAWPALAQGAWVPAVLLVVVAALAWSRIVGADFWVCLGWVAVMAAVALFCGWLQGAFGWTPAEISLEPPAAHVHEEHFHDHALDDAPGYAHTPEPSHAHDDHG